MQYLRELFSHLGRVYSPSENFLATWDWIFDGCMSVKYLGGVDPRNIGRMYVRQTFVGSTPPQYLTGVCPSNVWEVYTPKIFDGCMSVKCL